MWNIFKKRTPVVDKYGNALNEFEQEMEKIFNMLSKVDSPNTTKLAKVCTWQFGSDGMSTITFHRVNVELNRITVVVNACAARYYVYTMKALDHPNCVITKDNYDVFGAVSVLKQLFGIASKIAFEIVNKEELDKNKEIESVKYIFGKIANGEEIDE